jgi:hypothetical protein
MEQGYTFVTGWSEALTIESEFSHPLAAKNLSSPKGLSFSFTQKETIRILPISPFILTSDRLEWATSLAIRNGSGPWTMRLEGIAGENGDNAKIMTGIHCDDIDSGSTDVYDGWTTFVAFLTFF